MAEKTIRLNLGCGETSIVGYIDSNCDIIPSVAIGGLAIAIGMGYFLHRAKFLDAYNEENNKCNPMLKEIHERKNENARQIF